MPDEVLPTGPERLLEPSFAEAILAIEAAPSMTKLQKSHWCCSLRQVAKLLERPPESVVARWTAVRIPIASLHHAMAGRREKTLQTDLEYALGVRPLDRSQRGAEPTVYGRALLDGGLNAFDNLKQAVKRIEFLADPTVGEVRVGSTVIVASSFIATAVDRLSRQYPRVTVHLLAAEAAMIYRALEEREVEVVIAGIFDPGAKDHLNAEVLYDDPFVIAAGVRNPWCRRRRVKLADLMNEPWTLPPPDSPSGSIIVELFRASGLNLPRATLVTSSIPARNALLARGRFLTVLPASVLKLAGADQEINALPIHIPKTGRPVGILTLKNRTLSPVAQLFLKSAREVATFMTSKTSRLS